MKKIIIIAAVMILSLGVFSQEAVKDTSYWKAGGTVTFTFSQVGLTNWAAGGENSVSGNGMANLFLNYNRDRASWESYMGMAYGLMQQGGDILKKTDDKIELFSKFGYQAVNKWYYTILAGFTTQFTDGYSYPNDSVPISRLLAPGYINLSAGMDYKPSKYFNLYIAPVSGKITIVNDETLSAAGAFGVDPGKHTRSEFGGFLKAMYTRDIMENVNLLTKLDLFSNYIENPQYVDVSWEVTLTMSVNKWLTANIHTHLIFDEDIKFPEYDNAGNVVDMKSKVQFKEVLGAGVSFKF
jgi:hypothetical protein